MKKIFLAAVAAFVVAGLVFVACKKEITNTDKVATEQVVKHQKLEGDSLTSTFFTSTNGPDGPFYDEYGNFVDMAPIYEPPVGEGGLSSIDNIYHVTCVLPGNTCGRVWVDINGVDHEGVYWCDPNGNNHIIDLSWRLGHQH
ncbi:MAG: hypothetical protein J5606_06560 [Bacteroidales bacterium]|nr:hypothetical protein [Bacteroidales bacterium]